MRRARAVGLGSLVLVASLGLAWLLREERSRGSTSVPVESGARSAPEGTEVELAGSAEPEAGAPAAREALTELREPGSEAAVASRSVRVLVTDAAGSPIAGAKVQGFRGSISAESRETDAEGRCELRIVPLEFLVERDGYAHLRVKRQIAPRPLSTFVLYPATTLAGRVLDRVTRLPIGGAVIQHEHKLCKGCPVERLVTGDDGRYELAGLPVGPADKPLRFLVRAPGYDGEWIDFVLRDPVPTTARDFELTPRTEIEGQVVDMQSGAPIAGARIQIGLDVMTSDESGRFSTASSGSADPAENRIMNLEVLATGYPCLWVPLEGLESPVLLRLPRCASLTGRILDGAGRPVSEANLTLGNLWAFQARIADTPYAALPEGWRFHDIRFHASSDGEGLYRLDGLMPWFDTRVMVVVRDGFLIRELPVPALSPGQEYELDVELVPYGTGTINGEVTLNGKPGTGVVAWRIGDEWGQSGETEIDTGGRYRLEHVPTGRVRVEFIPMDEAIQEFVSEARADLVLAQGQELRHDFHIELPLGSIAGHVRFEDGSPVTRAEVRASSVVPKWNVTARTDDSGSYAIKVPDRGFPFELSASVGNLRRSRTGVAAGSRDVDLVFPAMGKLLFRVVDRDTGEPVMPFGLSWRPAGGGDHQYMTGGQGPRDSEGYHLAALPAGLVDLALYAGHAGYQGSVRESIQLVAGGEPAKVSFELERGITLRLQLDPPGKLPRGAFVTLPPADAWSALTCSQNERGNNLLSSGGRYPATFLGGIWFDDEGRSSVNGLAPGRYRFKVFHEDVALDPEEIEVRRGSEEPVVVKWRTE